MNAAAPFSLRSRNGFGEQPFSDSSSLGKAVYKTDPFEKGRHISTVGPVLKAII